MNISETIQAALGELTRSERKVATYFLANPNDFAFETLDTIAAKMNTSTTSVIRFCRKLGFSGYKAFQDEVRAGFKYEQTLPDKFKRAVSADAYSQTVRNTIDCIDRTFRALSASQIDAAVDAVAKAERVFCFGLKESYALAHYAYTRFLTVRQNVFLLTAGQSGEIESVLSLGKGDVCVFFLFHRYTRQSPKILELLKRQSVTVVLITAPPHDAVESNASVLLPCFVNINGIKNSAAAPVCLVDRLCNALAVAGGDQTLDHMKQSEALFKDFTF